MGTVVQDYDYDKMFPMYGFGGIPGHMGIPQVSHCFPVNGNPECADIQGISGIVAAYKSTIHLIPLSGPTLFCPLLEEFKKLCTQNKASALPIY